MVEPVEIKRVGVEGLNVRWSDGTSNFLSSKLLRENCPAADSRAKRGDTSHDSPLSPSSKSLLTIVEATAEEELTLEKIWPIGNYAIGLGWADGHKSGIYTFSFLRELAKSA